MKTLELTLATCILLAFTAMMALVGWLETLGM